MNGFDFLFCGINICSDEETYTALKMSIQSPKLPVIEAALDVIDVFFFIFIFIFW
jgi:hypothetical protein